MEEPEGDGEAESGEDHPGNKAVLGSRGVESFAKSTPRYSVAVVRLYSLSRPHVATLHIKKSRALGTEDSFHDDVVEQTTL